MTNLKIKLNGKSSVKIVSNDDRDNTDIRPFKQTPCVNDAEQENMERINAHDLFSHYTAEIIREDIVYAR